MQEGNGIVHDFWVLKGLGKACHCDREGREHILQFAMEDWWITVCQAYFNPAKATLNVDCLEDTEVLCLSLENTDKVCAGLPKIEHFFRKSNAGYIALQCRILFLPDSNAKER